MKFKPGQKVRFAQAYIEEPPVPISTIGTVLSTPAQKGKVWVRMRVDDFYGYAREMDICELEPVHSEDG